jgi:hypothetical protein
MAKPMRAAAAASSSFKHLLSPLELASGHVLKNRSVMGSMHTGLEDFGVVRGNPWTGRGGFKELAGSEATRTTIPPLLTCPSFVCRRVAVQLFAVLLCCSVDSEVRWRGPPYITGRVRQCCVVKPNSCRLHDECNFEFRKGYARTSLLSTPHPCCT